LSAWQAKEKRGGKNPDEAGGKMMWRDGHRAGQGNLLESSKQKRGKKKK